MIFLITGEKVIDNDVDKMMTIMMITLAMMMIDVHVHKYNNNNGIMIAII